MPVAEFSVHVDEWRGCYKDTWKNVITDWAFEHPAKFSRALIRRIYEHAITENWIGRGSTVIDPFGGVALGACDALQLGLHWTGVELEPKFYRLATGYECPGFTSNQWAVSKLRTNVTGLSPYARALYWISLREMVTGAEDVDVADLCHECREAIGREPIKNQQSGLFAGCAEIEVPSRSPHHFDGNLDLWRRRAFGGSARLIQGDSRKLLNVLSESRLSENRQELNSQDLSIQSPPYISGGHHNDVMGAWNANGRGHGVSKEEAGYGAAEGQIGQMREGELAVSSPPYHNTVRNRSSEGDDKRCIEKGLDPLSNGRGHGGRVYSEQYGTEEGQIGNLPAADEGLSLAVTSPPYGQRTVHNQSGIDWEKAGRSTSGQGGQHHAPGAGMLDGYGETPGQLARLNASEENHDIAVSSPPYVNSLLQGEARDPEKMKERERRHLERHPDLTNSRPEQLEYGSSEGQLGLMKPGDLDLAVSSPPYGGVSDKHDRTGAERAARRHEEKGFKQGSGSFKSSEAYGRMEGQLGGMEDDGFDVDGLRTFDASIGSPPYPQPHSAGGGLNVHGYSKDWQKEDLRDMVGRRTYQGRGGDREEGNLETMSSNGFDAAIASPPYANQDLGGGDGQRKMSGSFSVEKNKATKGGTGLPGTYGNETKGQIAALPVGDFDAAVTSPPYEKSDITSDRNFIGGGGRETAAAEAERGYSQTEANLGNLPKGEFESALTNPPYEHDTEPHGDLRPDLDRQHAVFVERNYGSPENCSSLRGEDFWSASRLILEQLFLVLRPGGHACFVVKRFCRDGSVVDFPLQWATLCEAVGFRWIHDHRALLTEEHGTQFGFEEDKEVKTTRRSFFRRLYEQKYPENAIEWENVLCFVKPERA